MGEFLSNLGISIIVFNFLIFMPVCLSAVVVVVVILLVFRIQNRRTNDHGPHRLLLLLSGL